jgi:hypothetical protein
MTDVFHMLTILESKAIVRKLIENGWFTPSMLTKFIVFAANYSNQSKSLFSSRKW